MSSDDVVMTFLTRLRELEQKTTPGPWEHFTSDAYGKDDLEPKEAFGYHMREEDGLTTPIFLGLTGPSYDPECKENANVIVALRNAVPELIAVLEEIERSKHRGYPRLLEALSALGQIWTALDALDAKAGAPS